MKNETSMSKTDWDEKERHAVRKREGEDEKDNFLPSEQICRVSAKPQTTNGGAATVTLMPVAAREVNRSREMEENSDSLRQMSWLCPQGVCAYVCVCLWVRVQAGRRPVTEQVADSV